ncbi:MAG: hypothetical protein ND895_00770 [Pyrinomonadaceae bacterium]|nr:hypothetical protein [Pyrinomonadaceae bacterium]
MKSRPSHHRSYRSRSFAISSGSLAAALGLWSCFIVLPYAGMLQRANAQAIPQRTEPTDRTMRPIPVLDGVYVDKNSSIGMNAGEVQSTVIPPGLKSNCPNGRLLISNDNRRDPGQILLVDANGLYGTPKSASFEALSIPDTRILSNDHDLVTLNNGDVLYIRMGQTKKALSPKPIWFDSAYKIVDGEEPWGPGARSAMLIWRSTDGGENFKFRSMIDLGVVDDDWGDANDGSGGLPQGAPVTTSPGTPQKPIYQMGGTDGPFATVDRATGRVFISMGIGGNLPDTSSTAFKLSGTQLKRTCVVMSSDKGLTWQKAGNLGHTGWRIDIVPRKNDGLSFATSGWDGVAKEGHTFIEYETIGAFSPPDAPPARPVAPEIQGKWGWSEIPWTHPLLYKRDKDSTDAMNVNMATQTLLVRSPSSDNLILAFADTLENNKGDGYRVFVYNGGESWTQLPPLAPMVAKKENFILHPTAIDPGKGPILLYWYDVDTETRKAAIRGRLITRDDQYTADFPISTTGTASRSFSVDIPDWYGDYHTAGGYQEQLSVGHPAVHNYFPVWIEPNGRVHFTKVQYREAATPGAAGGVTRRPQFFDVTAKEKIRYSGSVRVSKLQILGQVEEDAERQPETRRTP